jgi:hypothetical protein
MFVSCPLVVWVSGRQEVAAPPLAGRGEPLLHALLCALPLSGRLEGVVAGVDEDTSAQHVGSLQEYCCTSLSEPSALLSQARNRALYPYNVGNFIADMLLGPTLLWA